MTFQQPNKLADLVVAFIAGVAGIAFIFEGAFIFGLLIVALVSYSIYNILKSAPKSKEKIIPHWKSREWWDR